MHTHTRAPIQTVAPFFVATAMSGIRRANWIVAHPVAYTRAAVATIGIQRFTHGYLSHAVQVSDMCMLSRVCVRVYVHAHACHMYTGLLMCVHKLPQKRMCLHIIIMCTCMHTYTHMHSCSQTLSLSLSLSLSHTITHTHTYQGYIISLIPEWLFDTMSWKMLSGAKQRYLRKKAKAQ